MTIDEAIKGKELDVVCAIESGDIWECPVCHKKYHLLHREVRRQHKVVKHLKHDFEEVIE